MNCHFCSQTDLQEYHVLPIRRSKLVRMSVACTICTWNSRVFCREHQQIHRSFSEGVTACFSCIDELVELYLSDAALIAGAVKNAISQEEYYELVDVARVDSQHMKIGDEDISILRFLMAKALNQRCSMNEVVAMVRAERSICSVINLQQYFFRFADIYLQ